MDKLWYIQTTEYYSALRRKELLRHERTWRKLKRILLSERSHAEKLIHCMIPPCVAYGKGKTMQAVKRSVVAGQSGWWQEEQAENRIFRAVRTLCMIM